MEQNVHICDTNLVLGMNTNYDAVSSEIPSTDHQQHCRQRFNIIESKLLEISNSNDELCLNLCLSNGSLEFVEVKLNASKGSCSSPVATHGKFLRQSSPPHSTSSSFSDDDPYSIMKEKEYIGVTEGIAMISDDVFDDDYGNAKKKLRLTKEQSTVLEDQFRQHNIINSKQKQVLAKTLKLRSRQVEVWFQNRRARTKLKQTQIDYELLKKCCEALKNENRKLIKDLQELKALKFSAIYNKNLPMPIPSLCPSCERGSSATDGPKGGHNLFSHSATS